MECFLDICLVVPGNLYQDATSLVKKDVKPHTVIQNIQHKASQVRIYRIISHVSFTVSLGVAQNIYGRLYCYKMRQLQIAFHQLETFSTFLLRKKSTCGTSFTTLDYHERSQKYLKFHKNKKVYHKPPVCESLNNCHHLRFVLSMVRNTLYINFRVTSSVSTQFIDLLKIFASGQRESRSQLTRTTDFWQNSSLLNASKYLKILA